MITALCIEPACVSSHPTFSQASRQELTGVDVYEKGLSDHPDCLGSGERRRKPLKDMKIFVRRGKL